jgi:1,4-dihydroxy-2-naphthoyl-CoA hydrolase
MSGTSIWKKPISPEIVNRQSLGSVNEFLGIEIVEVTDTTVRGRVPVTERTRQPFGLLHGGVSVVLAETLGSVGAFYTCEEGYAGVGLEVNANHLRPVKDGYVYGVATPVHLGRGTQVWEIRMSDEQERPTCIARLTISVVKLPAPAR